MVHLKSFKYLDGPEGEQSARGSPASRATRSPEVQTNESNSEEERSSSVKSANSTASSASTGARDAATLVGGNLTNDSGSQQSIRSDAADTRMSSVDECQSARLNLADEEDESGKENQSGAGEAQSKETSGSGEQDSNVTKIQIDHAQGETRMQVKPSSTLARVKQECLVSNQPPNTPLTPRLRLHMPRSQTSPSHLNQMAKSPLLARGLGNVTPVSVWASPLLGGKPAQSSADNTSQYSYAMQQRNTQFEIRWHNVKLSARPQSRLPRVLTESPVYKALFGSSEAEGNSLDKSCYSPPVQHKIPPTIDERFEMKTQAIGELKPADVAAKTQPAPNVSAFHRSISSAKLEANESGASSAKGRCILNSVSGQVFSGQMTAILGPSGVGKTSLLNSLTGRNTLDGTGRVSLIGANDSKRMSVVTVPQNDVLPDKLTAIEDLQFTSRLKNPQAHFDHRRNIERIVKCLHMEKFLNTRIDRLSGGEARRLSIGRELLNSPDILILDEPTSGLDANTCKKIITALRDIVEHSDNILDKPMSIIITIHQPQQEVYNLFHRVYVMAVGGRVIFEGLPHMLLPTLYEQSSLSRVTPVDQLNENPAIVAIEVASGEFGAQIIDELALYHENQVYEEFVLYNTAAGSLAGGGGGGIGTDSPMPPNTPRSLRQPHKSPLSVSRLDISSHRKRLNSIDSSVGRPTPNIARRHAPAFSQFDRMSSFTSLSYASTYDADLPEPTSKLKVDKRLRRSVVMKSNFFSHTNTLIKRCWLLTRRDMFLMAIRIIGFLGVAGGIVQIFSNALDPEQHQCPKFESEVDDMYNYIGEVRDRLHHARHALVQANSTHMFFFQMLFCITIITSALAGLVFPLQMRMFIREYKNGWYSPASFIMSQTIAELPADIIGPLLTLVITYPLCHQPDSLYHWRFIGYGVVMVLCAIICKAQALVAGAFLMDSVENSVFISCVLVSGPALLSGICVRVSQMTLPMQWLSYTSFLRFGFESMLALRYGYDMCPCDPEIVNGYPITASARAIPPHLENLAAGLLAVSVPGFENNTAIEDGTSLETSARANMMDGRENLFLRFIRLVTDAGNMFQDGEQLGNCKSYRSLYLISMDIPNDVLSKWIPLMLFMFVVSRILTYFAVKTVIKLRRS